MIKVRIEGIASKDLEPGMIQALVKGDYTVENQDGETILWINLKEPRKSLSKSENRASVSDIEALTNKHGIPLTKRKYTRRKDWKEPGLTRHHDANKTDAHFQARVSKEVSEMADAFIKANKLTKKEFVERAFLMLMKYEDDLDL